MEKKYFLLIGIIVCMISAAAHGFGEKTFFSIRSQSVNSVRDLVGWQQEINRYDEGDEMFTVFSIVPEYSRSFASGKIAKILFGSECLTFSGSRYQNRGKTDVLSDYFGLPSDFKSIVSFDPCITNFLMDFGWFHGLDAWAPGLYYRVHMPIVHAKWDLKMHEKTKSYGTRFNTSAMEANSPPATYPAGYLSPQRILLNDSLPRNMIEAFEGKKSFGDMGDPLRFGKIFGRQTLTRASELQVAVGWNFFQKEWWHTGVQVRCAAPIGNRSQAEFLFEPMVGNGGHWELGIGLSGHVQLWESGNQRDVIALYSDLNITHLFNATEKRSFDFTANGHGSRYMLLADIEAPSIDLFLDSMGTLAANQYQRRLVPAINKTTLDTSISIAVQIDWVIKCAWQRDNFEVDLGYNFWFHSKEQLNGRCAFESNRFGLKGDAQVYGFDLVNQPVPLNATQHSATVLAGQGSGNSNYSNSNADNPQNAFDISNVGLLNLTISDSAALNIAQASVQLSNPAILLKDADLNICSGLLPYALSHKIFTHVNYAWRNYEAYTPYLGIGSAVEWACNCFKKNSASSQWSIWLKGGLSY